MKSKDDILKIRATVLYLLNKFPEGVDYIKLFKIIYFAQQRHLSTYGRVIINETFHAKKHGPVPSFAYNAFLELEKNSVLHSADIETFVSGITIKDKLVSSQETPDMDELSASDIKCLEYSYERCKDKKPYSLSKKSHDGAWENATSRRILDPENDRMTVLEIAKAGNASEGMLNYIRNMHVLNDCLKSGC